MNPIYFVPTLSIAMMILFIFVFASVKRKEKEYHARAKTGPFSDAIIEKTEKKYREGRDGIHNRPYYDCYIRYEDNCGVEHRTVLPYMPYSEIPVGGTVRIAYNPEDFNDIALVEATFMNTPEYIQMMEEKGYKRTEYGFERV